MVDELPEIQVDPLTIVFSLFGGYVLPRGEEVWIGTLIQAMAALDYGSGAVRALVSRMQRKGYLVSRRQGRNSFYRLTARGQRQVQWGGGRAFGASEDKGAQQWTVITYSVPERHRQQRDALRDLLRWWGFGALAPGTWLSPRPLWPEAEETLQRLGLWQYLEIFCGRHLGSSDIPTLVVQAWPQLPHLAACYQAYIARYAPVLKLCQAGSLEDKHCFAHQLRCLCEFVAITLEDPILPLHLLPEDWPRPTAQTLFKQLQCACDEPANRFFDSIYRTIGGSHEGCPP